MDIKTLKIDYGDTVILTYDKDADMDAINRHYMAVKDMLHAAYGCVVVANREDLLKDIAVISNDGGYPFG